VLSYGYHHHLSGCVCYENFFFFIQKNETTTTTTTTWTYVTDSLLSIHDKL